MDLAKFVVYSARRFEAEPAIAFAGGVVTYKALMGATAAAVQVIEALRLPPRSVVVLDVRNPVFHTVLIYALALCGHCSASVGSVAGIERAGPEPDLVLTDRDDVVTPPAPPLRRVDPRWFAHDEGAPVDYPALLAKPGFSDPDAVMRLIYSSGTTGRPKCVGLTSRTLELRIARSELQMPNRAAGGAQLNTQSFSTIMGTVMTFQAPTSGVLLCHASSGGEALQMIRAFGVSFLACSVGQLQGLMKVLGVAAAPPTLKAVLAMGAPMSRTQLKEVRARLCSHVMGMYGSTEMGRVAYAEPRDLDHNEGSVGLPVPFMSVEVVDGEGTVLPAGKDGILRVKSDALAVYVDEAGKASSCAEADGWFYPGDVGRVEPDGRLVVTGRTTEVLNRGGVIVAPEAIEEVLRGFAGVEDIAVVGVPRQGGVDEIWAAVVPSGALDAQGLLNASRARLGERAPDRLFQVGRLPRAESGKVMRNAVRDELLARQARGN